MAPEEERRSRERAESAAREARALADEREKRIEAATLTKRADRVDELRAVLKTLQEQQGRAEHTGKTRSAPKRRTKPEW